MGEGVTYLAQFLNFCNAQNFKYVKYSYQLLHFITLFQSIMGLVNFAFKFIHPVRISYLFALEVVQNTNIAIGMGVIEAYLFEIDLMYVQHQAIKQTKGRGIQKWPCRKYFQIS